MKRILITEGLSDILYHVTSISFALSILKTNQFKLTPTVRFLGADNISQNYEYPLSKNKLYFISFARSAWSKYGMYNNKHTHLALFVVDGRRIGSVYKGTPVNFTDEDGHFMGVDNYGYYQEEDEMEDRIVSDKPTIPNVSKYIKELRLYLEKSRLAGALYDRKSLNQIRKIILEANRRGIRVRMWNDLDAMKMGDRRSELKLKDIMAFLAKGKVGKYDTTTDNDITSFSDSTINNSKYIAAYTNIALGHGSNKDMDTLVDLLAAHRPKFHKNNLHMFSVFVLETEIQDNPRYKRFKNAILRKIRDSHGGSFSKFHATVASNILKYYTQ